MDSSVLPKDEIWFLRVCHHISNAVYEVPSSHSLSLSAILLGPPAEKAMCILQVCDPGSIYGKKKCQNQVYQYMNLHCCEYSNLMYIKCKIIAKKIRFKLQTCFFLTVNAEIKAWTDPMLLPDLHVHDTFYKQYKIIMNRT